MKIQGGGSGKPVDFNQARVDKNSASEVKKLGASDEVTDSVDTKLAATLNAVTQAISESGLTAGQLHSFVDEKRLDSVLKSLDRVEGKRPEIDPAHLKELSEKIASKMESNPQAALQAFKPLDPSRVAELLQ